MANKFTASGSALIITDTEKSIIILEAPKKNYYFDNQRLIEDNIVKIYNINDASNKFPRMVELELSDCIDENGVSFTTSTFRDFSRLNLGFSTASGSSEAVNVETLKHFVYNPVTDKLEADKAIETTLSSLFLGEQHRMSSGGENVFFTNQSAGINWYPMWGGLKDMSISSNKSPDGIIEPSARKYSNFSSLELNGGVSTGVTDATNSAVIPVNISGVGADMVIEETIVPTDTIYYKIWYGLDDSGVQAFESKKTGLNFVAGDSYEWIYEHPLEVHAGQAVYARLDVESADGSVRTLQIRKAVNGKAWFTIQSFIFTDEDLATKADIDAIVSGSEYKGAYNAATDTPSLAVLGGENSGDYFRVSVSGGAYETGDLIIYNGTTTSYDHIAVRALTQTQLETSSLKVYDIYVKANFASTIKNGSALHPYSDIQNAIDNSVDGNSIYLDGEFTIANEIILPNDKSLYFYGNDKTKVKYSSYNASNGNIFSLIGNNTKEVKFNSITFKNAGGYGLLIKKTVVSEIRNCKFYNNGWDGTQLNTVLPSATSGLLGYDSTNTDLQAFYAGSHASNGGAVRLEECKKPLIRECRAENNLRGFRIQDCGINGGGFIIENQSISNIESGIYIAAGSLGGCQNITVTINYSSYNANNGLLCIGGINNKFSQNEVNGNWNAGLCAWGSSNLTLRDSGLYDNNRSNYNGIGNTGDAKASIQINDAYSFIATQLAYNPNFRFIAEILDTQVHYTGLGSNTEKIGFLMTSGMGLIPDNDKNIIKIDDVGFIGQDYAIDLSEVDVTNLRLSLGDNSFQSIGEKAVKAPLLGDYYELPYSNHTMGINYADFSVDSTGSIIIKEGAGGNRMNPYKVNDLQAVANGANIKVILKDSDKIQFTVPVSGCSIDGSMVNSVLNQALVQLNALFTNTSGFASGGNPVTGFALTGDNLTLTLQDGTSYTVDVTSLGVDENNFVSSGALSGSNLVLTMTDASTVTIDASNMINGSSLPSVGGNWYYAYGAKSGEEYTHPVIYSGSRNDHPFYYGTSLKKGREFIWQHDTAGTVHIGKWDGITHAATGTDSGDVGHWDWKYAVWYAGASDSALANSVSTTTDNSPNTNQSVGVDIDSRHPNGYTVSNNTMFMLRLGEDNYTYLYDVTDNNNQILISKSLLAETEDEVFIHLTGMSVSVQANIPQFVERTSTWTIVADFDDSENGEWSDGIEIKTIIKSNLELEAGYQFVWQLPTNGNNRYFGIGYTGTLNGETYPDDSLVGRWRYHSRSGYDGIQNASDWTFNTSNSMFDSLDDNAWENSTGSPVTVSYRYNTNNVLEMWDEDSSQLIMTYNLTMDGNSISLFYGADEYASSETIIPNLSVQQIGQGSQPITSFAPDVISQSHNVTESESFGVQIDLETDSDIVTMYGESDAPSWVILNQDTGMLTGTAPSYTGSSDDYVINCKAANPLGGITSFQVTLNVIEQTYTNTKSLKFVDGVNSYLGGNASLVTSLERSSNGSGSSDAWTVAFWYKKGVANQGQTLFYFGHNDIANNGHIEIKNTSNDRIRLRYGSTSNFIQLQTTDDPLTTGWNHIVVSYDGGTTGSASGSVNDYYSRFDILINGASEAVTTSQGNYGYNGSIVGQNFRFGKLVSGNYPKDGLLNQLAIWNSDQSSNITGLYNSGSTQDISTLQAGVGSINTNYLPPAHYYEIENSVTTIQDLSGSAHLVGYNFSSGDLVTDAP